MDFEYIVASIAGSGTDAAFLAEDLEGCECADGQCTSADGCRCLPGNRDNYDARSGKWIHHDTGIEVAHLECHQVGPCPNGKGIGVFASALIEAGTFVVEYVGEVLGEEEARRRIANADGHEHNYLFTIREFIRGECRSTFIDARHKGNISRFINHSCEPNLALQIVRLGRQCPSLAMFASRDIHPGEELAYSYGYLVGTDGGALAAKACLCGASSCIGRLPSATTI